MIGLRAASCENRENSRDARHRRLASRACVRSSTLTTRNAVTLIELLVTITIISILAATFLGVSNAAMESSRRARTQTLVNKIHGLLLEKWNEYQTRRVDLAAVALNSLNAPGVDPRERGMMLQDMRLLALRELMAIEMPDRWSDILLAPVGGTPSTLPRMLNAFPAIQRVYLRRYNDVITRRPPGVGDNTEDILANQGAECLYMIIMLTTGDGEARTLFSEQNIGDVDDDGAPEFLDGWGRPISYIRWPAGFALRSDLMTGDPDADTDPLDLFRRDQPNAFRPNAANYSAFIQPVFIDELSDENAAFRLVPLVYSTGPDGEGDIDDSPYTGGVPPTSLDPYAIDPAGLGAAFVPSTTPNFVYGLPKDLNDDGEDNSLDNIHNHLLDN